MQTIQRIKTFDNSTHGIVELVTVLVAVTDYTARVLTVKDGRELPSGALSPIHHSLQAGVRDWVHKQTAQPMGYVEQLYTFVDTHRQNQDGLPVLYVSYLGLVNEAQDLAADAIWCDWYQYFPWEDTRCTTWQARIEYILQALKHWADNAPSRVQSNKRHQRIQIVWGTGTYTWMDDMVLLRYEMLYEAGLITESPTLLQGFDIGQTGIYMNKNHRRVLATALARLRAKIKYRPVIFELMPEQFTLLALQKSIETLTGCTLHKQNFRRQIFHQALIEPCSKDTVGMRGRPAQLYRFKDNVLLERSLSSTRLPVSK